MRVSQIIRGSCTHRARTVQSFSICVFMGTFPPRFQVTVKTQQEVTKIPLQGTKHVIDEGQTESWRPQVALQVYSR